MRKVVAALVALVIAAPAVYAAPADAPDLQQADAAEETRLFAGGGTLLSNGFFFPGMAFANDDGSLTGEPYVVPAGNDIRFTNLDHFVVAGGAHAVRSFKKMKIKRRGRNVKVPLFSTKLIDGPGEALMKTSHVKPGTYSYYCPVHSGMIGLLTFE